MMNEIIISLSYTKSHRHFGLPSKMYKNIIYGVGGIFWFSVVVVSLPNTKKWNLKRLPPKLL
jgi:hypothetical protein